MSEWEQHHKTLHGLYMTENKTAKETKEHMESVSMFQATLPQYVLQFKKWKWRKNMKKSDWVYVSRKLNGRGRKVTSVYHNEIPIDTAKVSKNISRYVHPNDEFKSVAQPPSPGYITVCTPRESSPVYQPDSPQSTYSIVLADGRRWQNAFCVLGEVDLRGLPYFQLRDMLNSEDVKRGFREILTMSDPLHGNIIHHFWPDSSLSISDHLLSDSPYSADDVDMDDEWRMIFQHPSPKPKPFGVSLLQDKFFNGNDLIHQQRMILDLHSFLGNIPFKDDKEIQALQDLLLGPPTIEAARRFIEVGIYIVSNNLFYSLAMKNFIESMFQSIPWPILRPLLSIPAPSIQAFTESIFLHAITTSRLIAVEDLIQHESIRATVVSNGAALVSAVQTSNCNLVSLILDAGACPCKDGSIGKLPLSEARTVQVAQLLVNAGADIDAMATYNLGFFKGPAVVAATAHKNVDLVRYLINEGADVNRHVHDGYTAAMMAVDSGMIEILEMLLQAKANPDDISETRLEDDPSTRRMTPLQKAARTGDIDAVQLLIKYGGDVNTPAYEKPGMTALQAAVSQVDFKMVKVLLENGGDVNAPDNRIAGFPRSLLTIAVEMNHPDLVQIILDAGAQVNIPSFGFYGCTALESAMALPCVSGVRDLLVAKGALHSPQFNNDYRQILLRQAVLAGDLTRVKARVKALLETGLKIDMRPFVKDKPHLLEEDRSSQSINQRSRFYVPGSIVQHAIVNGSAVFRILFDVVKSYKEDIDFHPLLVEATKAKNDKILILLLDAGADINSTCCLRGMLIGTPLMFAVQKNDLRAVKILCSRGADVNVAVEGFVLNSLRAASTALQITLWWCARHGNHSLDVFHFLRLQGATSNGPISKQGGRSELTLAVETGDLAIVRELLDIGSDVNSPPAEIHGATALQAAAGHGYRNANIEMVQLLLRWNADVNAPPAAEEGYTALGAATAQGSFHVALILLKAGADVNAKSTYYSTQTPLHIAASRGRLDTVHLLLKAGADLHLPEDERYFGAAYLARRMGHIAIATILENWKGDENLESSLKTAISRSKGKARVVELD